jgi:thiamine-phosphate diphosphorylase
MSKMIGRREKLKRLTGLYVIIDSAFMDARSYEEVTRQIISGGAGIIQLRDKRTDKKVMLVTAEEVKTICTENDVLFIINDHLDIALAVEADGLHIGAEDLPSDVARRLLPHDRILGCSARTVEDALALSRKGADYLGVGAMFATGTKDRAEVVGKERLKDIKEAVSMPVVAIGGINKDNAGEVADAGADAVAVISAVLGTDDIKKATRQLVEIIQGGEHG